MPTEKPAVTVFCVRNRTAKSAEEHLSCPYCHGKSRLVVEAGERAHFCDFDPEHDPISFGFPDGSSRTDRN